MPATDRPLIRILGLVIFLAALVLGASVVPASAAPPVETIAGGGSGDGLPALAIGFSSSGFAVDAGANVVFTDDVQRRLRRIDAATGLVGAFPAPNVLAFCGSDPVTDDCLFSATSLAIAPNGDVLVGDYAGRVFRIAAGTGAVSRVAGLPNAGSTGCSELTPAHASVPALAACLDAIRSIGTDAAGNVFLAEGAFTRIRRIDAATGTLTSVAGIDGFDPPCADGAVATTCALGAIFEIAVTSGGDVLLAGPHTQRVRRVDAATGQITTILGADRCTDKDGAKPKRACTSPSDLAVDGTGILWVFEVDGRVRRIDAGRKAKVRTVATVVGGAGITLDPAGQPYVLYDDTPSPFSNGRARIARLGLDGTLTPVAGNGSQGHCGDGGPATAACLDDPRALAVAPDGAILVRELGGSNRIRRVDAATGVITTIAGDGTTSSRTRRRCPDGVAATASCFNELGDIAVAADGDVLAIDVGDAFDDAPAEPTRLRRIDAATGIVETIMEGAVCSGDPREDIPASDAGCVGFGVATDATGNVYLTEGTRIRRIDGATGRIRTIAGNGNFSFCGDGGLATRACLWAAEVVVDAAGNVFFLDQGYDWRVPTVKTGDRIRRVDAVSGIVTTIAGNGEEGLCGDGGPAVDACLASDHFTLDRDGGVLIDSFGRIRRVDLRTGIIDLVAGDPNVNCLSSDGSSDFDACAGAEALDADGHPIFIDRLGARVRRVTLPCGDGTLDAGEGCDDGNLVSGDGCDVNCTPTGCGNGIVTAGEGCDGGDCCDAACQPRTGNACDDGNACTTGDTCTADGRCAPAARVVCNAGPCATSVCDPTTATCVVTPFPSTLPPDFPNPYDCDDGDPCTLGHWCFNGTCSAGSPLVSCDDQDPCTVDAPTCEPGVGCAHTPLPEAAGLVCRCEHVFGSPFCDDIDDLPRKLAMDVRNVCKALKKAVNATPGTRKALRAAASASAKAGATADDFAAAVNAGRFDGGCGEDVAGTLLELVTKAAEVAAGAP